MICKNCGSVCRDDAKFCNTCGASITPAMGQPMAGQPVMGVPMGQPVGYSVPVTPAVPGKGMGIAGMVLGIIALVFFCYWPISLICGIIGVALSGAGLYKAKQVGMNNGMAVAGIVCSCIALAAMVIFIIWAASVASEFYYYF